MAQLAMVVDLDRCIACRGGCQVACKTENEIALGPSRSSFYTMGPVGQFPDIEMYFMPVMCQQCENPSCTAVCPTGACYKDEEDGVVYIEQELCIACGSCKRACPYHCNFLNNELHVMDKCNLCVQRRDDGLPPACVRNCAGGALHMGDIEDPNSEVSKMLANNEGHVYTLRDDMGNGPSGRFVLRNCTWIKDLPFEFDEKIKGGMS